MPLSFPLGFAAFQERLPVIDLVPFKLQRFEQTSGTAAGQPIVAEIAPPVWTAHFALAAMRHARASEIDGLMEAIGSEGRVYLCDPTRFFPSRDPRGVRLGTTPVTVSAIGSNGKSMRLAGLPAGYPLAAGDMVGVSLNAGRRALFRLSESASASSSGVTPFFDVSPHLGPGVAAGATATLRRPTARFVIRGWEPGRASGPHRVGMSFGAIEVPT